MRALADLDTKTKAVVNITEFKDLAGNLNYSKDSTATIKMTKYGTNVLTYESKSSTALPAIFSEIYYPAGWNCYLNGKQIETFKANYILRGAIIPAGTNKIEWKFEPESYAKASTMALIGSVLLIFALLVLVVFEVLKENTK